MITRQLLQTFENADFLNLDMELVCRKQGQPRIIKYFEKIDQSERLAQEIELFKKCISRTDKQCSFLEYKNFKVVYRRYASLYFIIGIDEEENELAVLELIHNLVETFDRYFDKVCELDIMYNLDRVHMIVEEMIQNGQIIESNKSRILAPVSLMDQAVKK